MPRIVRTYRPPQKPKAPDGGRTYESPTRFPKLSDLMNLYETTRKIRGEKKAWRNIMKQYQRLSYADGDGNILPNFGVLRSKVDKALTAYADFATERDPWNRITTDAEGEPEQQMLWGDHITNAFQKYCISKWDKSFSEMLLGCRDMLLFSKGAYIKLKDSCPYPENIAIDNVWPDANAGMFPDTFDVLYVEWRFTAVELFREIEYEKEYEEGESPRIGWRKDAVMRLLRSVHDWGGEDSHDSIFRRFQCGDVPQSLQDTSIDVVYAYVKEYRRQSTDGYDEGYKEGVSKYIFPARRFVAKHDKNKQGPATDEDANIQGHLYYSPHSVECMDDVACFLAHTVCRNFYEDPSFAELIYVTSKTYDQVMNRILQAVEDNMRVYLKSDSPNAYQKLKRMRHGMFQVLESGMKIEQERITRPIGDAANTLRMVVADEDMRQGEYTQVQSGSKQPKTARGEEVDLQERQQISSAHLKIFNQFVTRMMCQLYRSFTSQKENEDSKHWKNFRKFKAYLKKNHVPDGAWDYENINLRSIILPGAGSPAFKLQSARIVREALSIPAASPGERLVQRRMIGAAEGVENVDAFIPPDADMPIGEDSLIGAENDILSSPNVNPANAVVLSTQLHFRHIPKHIEDAQFSMQAAGKLFQAMEQFPEDDRGIHLQTVTDLLIGVDTKLTHTYAHIQLASRGSDKSKMTQLKQWAAQIQEINKMQDKLEEIMGETQQKRMEESRKTNGVDHELEHKKAMYALEEEHTANMLAFDFQKNQMKAEQLRSQSAENSKFKNAMEVVGTQHKAGLDTLKTAAKVRQDEIKSRSNGAKKPQPAGRR